MRWSNFHFVFVLNQFYIAKIQYAEIILLKIFFEIAITKMDDTNKKLHISQILQVTCKKNQKTDIQLLDWDHNWRFYIIRVLLLSKACIKKRLVELTIVGRLLLKLELVYVYKPKAVLWSKVEILTNSPLISDPFESYM